MIRFPETARGVVLKSAVAMNATEVTQSSEISVVMDEAIKSETD